MVGYLQYIPTYPRVKCTVGLTTTSLQQRRWMCHILGLRWCFGTGLFRLSAGVARTISHAKNCTRTSHKDGCSAACPSGSSVDSCIHSLDLSSIVLCCVARLSFTIYTHYPQLTLTPTVLYPTPLPSSLVHAPDFHVLLMLRLLTSAFLHNHHHHHHIPPTLSAAITSPLVG